MFKKKSAEEIEIEKRKKVVKNIKKKAAKMGQLKSIKSEFEPIKDDISPNEQEIS